MSEGKDSEFDAEETVETPAQQKTSVGKKIINEVKTVFWWIVIPLSVIVIIHTFLFQWTVVSGVSMYPTYKDGDLTISRMIGYTPKQGDVVTANISKHHTVIKRVIATEGQTVEINYLNDTVTVDGVVLEEPYLHDRDMLAIYGENIQTFTVPEGCVFLMGDNRDKSLDSQSDDIGFVKVDNVIGKVCIHIPIGSETGEE